MATKLQKVSELTRDTMNKLTYSIDGWLNFLDSAAWLYKYPWHEQVMIYAQRPDARACAPIELWNSPRFKRWVNKGAKGIALIDDSKAKPTLRYVFDVSDTNTRYDIPFDLWALKDGQEQQVFEELENRFGSLDSADGFSFPEQLIGVIHNAVTDNITDYSRELLQALEGSNLDEYDDFNVKVWFEQILEISVAYCAFTRLGLDAKEYFEKQDFVPVLDFNTTPVISQLGTATADISEMVLRQIERSVRNIELAERRTLAEKKDTVQNVDRKNERSRDYGTDIQTERGLLASRDRDGRAADGEHRQIRNDEENIPENPPQGDVQRAAADGQADRTPLGDRQLGENSGRADDNADGESGRRDRGTESQRPDEMGGTHEQLPALGGGSDTGGADIQLTPSFPTEKEQLTMLEKAEEEIPPFSVSQADFDNELCRGSGFSQGKLRIYAFYQTQPNTDSAVKFLKNEYGIGGHSHTYLDGSDGFVDHNGKGITFSNYNYQEKKLFRWNAVHKRISELIAYDRYLSEKEKEYLSAFEREQTERRLQQAEEAAAKEALRAAAAAMDERRKDAEYSFSLGDEVQLGAQTYHILGYDDTTVMLSDPKFPLLSENMPRDVFERRLRENPQNDRYIAEQEIDTEVLSQISPQEDVRTGGVITIGGDEADHEITVNASNEKWAEIKEVLPEDPSASESVPSDTKYNPLAPPYKVGDTVYLDDKPFEVTEVGDYNVQLRDPTLRYPVFRAENKTQFEVMLQKDSRNGSITEYLAQDLNNSDSDLQDVLTWDGGLLKLRDKEIIAGWFRAGKSNTRIAQRLSETYAGRSDAMTIQTGEEADYFASTTGVEINIQDKYYTKHTFSWIEITRILRAMYKEERDGFYHKPALRESVMLDGVPAYKVGDSVVVPYPDRDIKGTIGYIGDKSVRIDTGPYSWSHETVSRERFDELVSSDERNAHLFVPEIKEPDQPDLISETVAVYPAEKNNLPYDIVIQTLRTPEKDEPKIEPKIPKIDFRITNDELGYGGAKAKFRMNIDAINTLQNIEFENRLATPEEQEVLSRYVGWGGIPQAFEEGNDAWTSEFAELYAALSPEEYEAARASTLNAHYTSPIVIKAIYQCIENMGFRTGNILEPSCGIGNFFGLLPESMKGSRLYGVELDPITGRIAKQLYQTANIAIEGFENTSLPDSFFDLTVGNVPFGNYGVADKRYDKNHFHIHDYFFAKTLDKVRPGGVVAFITSSYTMDKKSPEVRKYIAERAELLGAIRLPNNAFLANAGTGVVTDILFLQKRDRPLAVEPEWVHLGKTEQGYTINQYFVDNPDMVLGELTEKSTQYGKQECTVKPIPGADLSEQLADAVANIHGNISEYEHEEDFSEMTDDSIPADPAVRNFSFALADGDVYYRENSRMNKVDVSMTAESRIKGMIEIRDCTRRLIEYQLEGYSDETISREQQNLNILYDEYTKKYGLLNSRGNKAAFSDDSSYPLLCSLEILDEQGNLKRKADMFTKRTINPNREITSVDTAGEALALSIGEKAKVDMAYMAELTGKTEEQLFNELKGVIFLNPMHGYGGGEQEKYLPADEYLSGNVREKLIWAKRSAKLYPEDYAVNVEALERVQPKDLTASEIDVRLGASWLPAEAVRQFIFDLLQPSSYARAKLKVHHSKQTEIWNIEGKNADYENVAANVTYGTKRVNAYKIIEETLNLRDVRIFDTKTDPDGKEVRVLNQNETILAQQKQQAVKDKFNEWIWRDADRREELTKLYNEIFNSARPREYDGSHIRFYGMNPEIQLRPHQVNAVARTLYGGNTLLGHVVGAGKTFEMAASAMESKRLGLCEKSLFVVPNHLTEQWASEFLQLYPAANILVATRKDFETHNRKRFCSRIATGDYDAVIIGHSQFEKIPLSRERQAAVLQEQIDEITDGILEAKAERAERFTIKQMEKMRKNLKIKLSKLNDQTRKDDVITFEELGIDRLFVDEAHFYKNLFLVTKMRNVAGLAQTEAQKSADLFVKCRYMDELTGGRGVIFATGTPISNSMTEMYTMQRYLQYALLQEKNLTHFDAWASTFGETVTAVELAPDGYTIFGRLN